MKFVALIRGINVGGNNTVNMKELKVALEASGFASVQTYINSGNIIVNSPEKNIDEVARAVAVSIEKTFGHTVKVIVKRSEEFLKIADKLPDDWLNDTSMKCDVMFLSHVYDNSKVLSELVIKPDIDRVLYVPGAVLWSVDRVSASRSGIQKLIGTKVYREMTIRNCNTLRKLAAMLRVV